ncbi:hypothetical protein K438DRAFT_1812906 [Mycena galopus ATCC 62051]|nr:hypothetical protein K438DRAFT_1812906 [Mycena galopus ATCC 62051]
MHLLSRLFSGKETAPHTADVNYYIADVVQWSGIKERISTWAARIFSPVVDTARLDDLHQCEIRHLAHYRAKGAIAHELIVVRICSTEDVRYCRFERFKAVGPDGKSMETFLGTKSDVSGKDTGNLDLVRISDQLDGLDLGDYQVVQSVSIPAGCMDIIDCAALAVTLAAEAQDYSLFHHICMWWAANFFTATCALLSAASVEVQHGHAFGDAGKIFGVRFIGMDGALVCSPDNLAALDGVLDEVDGEQLKIALRQDSSKLDKSRATQADQIFLQFRGKAQTERTALENGVKELHEREQRGPRLAALLKMSFKDREDLRAQTEVAKREKEDLETELDSLRAQLGELKSLSQIV